MLDWYTIKQWINLPYSRIHLFCIPQYIIQNRNVHISVLNYALWDMEQVYCGICKCGLLMKSEKEHATYLKIKNTKNLMFYFFNFICDIQNDTFFYL